MDERKEYARLRALGWGACAALGTARTNTEFAALEARGFVRLRVEADDVPYDASHMDDEIYTRHEKAALLARVEREGMWGFIIEVRNPYDAKIWEHVDSCWGFVGDDWQESGYDTQAKASALDALQAMQTPAGKQAARVRALPRAALEAIALGTFNVLHAYGLMP